MTTCGSCHDTAFIAEHSIHRDGGIHLDDSALLNGNISTDAEMNCFICHLEQPDNVARLAALDADNSAWASSATLNARAIITGDANGWQYNEAAATDAWRYLVAESVSTCILSGGVNHWLTTFGDDEFLDVHRVADADLTDELASFPMALGSRYDAANPNHDVFSYLEFESKVKLEAKRGPASGGCG